MRNRLTVHTGTIWEDIVGYSRAVRIGNIIEITGTVASIDGKIVGKGDEKTKDECELI